MKVISAPQKTRAKKTVAEKQMHRILVIAHAHPDFSLGGGELAAYNLFKAYRDNPEVQNAWFLARSDRHRGLTGAITLRRSNEYLWEQAVYDWHSMRAAHRESLTTWFADLIRALKPTIVHTHHYAHLGLEYLQVIKQVDPKIRIVMTLHEYMAICQNNGQMMKVGGSQLCSRSTPDECSRCFPDKTPEEFWLRNHKFKSYFSLVDQFVSPSKFLRQRYIEWGLPSEKIVVIENGQSDDHPLPPRSFSEGETCSRFGFFGQITPYKGLDILLEALHHMPKEERKKIVLEVHGANLELQSHDYQRKIEELRKPLIKQGVVQWIGPYRPYELRSRMANIDWVCVPSVWWENSPMVIQEAFGCGRPLLVSDIGGMKEKVRNGIDGFHVPVGNIIAWSNALRIAKSETEFYAKCCANIFRPISYQACAAEHLNYFIQTI